MSGHVILSHGQESGPDATKVRRLGAVAEALGWTQERPDYRGTPDPRVRIAQLRERIAGASAPVVLVGSSMGAYISGRVSLEVPVAGLYLLAPPVHLPGGLATLELRAPRCQIVHGWDDELIPAQEVVDFAAARRLAVLLVDADHRLNAALDTIAENFRQFLLSPGVGA